MVAKYTLLLDEYIPCFSCIIVCSWSSKRHCGLQAMPVYYNRITPPVPFSRINLTSIMHSKLTPVFFKSQCIVVVETTFLSKIDAVECKFQVCTKELGNNWTGNPNSFTKKCALNYTMRSFTTTNARRPCIALSLQGLSTWASDLYYCCP